MEKLKAEDSNDLFRPDFVRFMEEEMLAQSTE